MARPTYLKKRSVPDDCDIQAIDICVASETICGEGRVIGSQDMKSHWIIYVLDDKDADTLSERGIILGNKKIDVYKENPFEKDGIPIPSTKLIISNLPLTVQTVRRHCI